MDLFDEFYIIDNFFDVNTRKKLFQECINQFENNLLVSDYIDITNSIIDCHGLSLTNDKYFPYSVKCWNILSLKIKKFVTQYCARYGCDELSITPFSCWAERSGNSNLKYFSDTPTIVEDEQVKKHFIRSVYTLQNKNPECGTDIIIENDKVISIRSEENRLLIYDGIEYKSTQKYSTKDKKYNIIFDWYINDPFDVPDWILP